MGEYWTSVEQELEGNKPETMGKGFWNDLAVNGDLTEEDMRKYGEFFNWRKLSDHQKMSESFIRENAERVHWDRITQRIQMSTNFIEEFQDKVVWDYVWSYQRKLPIDFIKRHLIGHGRVDWDRIVMYQKLTEDFIIDHIDDLHLDRVLSYQKPKREFFNRLYAYCMSHFSDIQTHGLEKRLLWWEITTYKKVSEEDCLKYVELKIKEDYGTNGWNVVLEHQFLSEKHSMSQIV